MCHGEGKHAPDVISNFFPTPFPAISVYNIKTSAINGLFIYEITTATTRKVNVSKEEQHIFNNNTNYDNNN